MNRLGIAQRIYGSFGILIALLAVVCAAAYFGLVSIIGLLSDFRDTTQQTTSVSAIVDELNVLQLAALNYRGTHGKPAANAFAGQLLAVDFDDAALVASVGQDADTKAIFDSLKDDVASYAKAFNQSVKLNDARQAQVTAMRTTGGQAADAMNEVLQGAATIYDMKMTIQAAGASSSLQGMLTFSERYLVGAAASDFKGLTDQGAAAAAVVDQMAQHLFNPDLKAKAQTASTLLHDYLDKAGKLKAVVDQESDLETKTVDAIGAQMSSKLSGLTQQIGTRQSALGDAGEAAANRTLLLLAGGAAVALLLGIVMAVLIGRSLSGNIRAMAGNMRRLAEGDLDAELGKGAAGGELGQMAEALEVFRSNGRAVREMDALKAAESEQAAEALAHREAVLADVRRVVTAALAGDFSGRIDESAATDDLRDFAASLNSVMATVERGVDETGAVLDGLSNADLSRRVEGQYEGVFERLKDSTNTAVDKFSDIVQRLQATSRALKTATGEMLAGSNELSSRTTREAATIEETAAAMEQLSTAVASTADKANEASTRTQAASSLADEGGQVMLKATDAMERIGQSSGKISNIIALIDDIAFQTNLLALNASVEAARAGEAGKGFAVVAVEVRRLAQSAAQASSEVKVLIEQSGTEVSGGSKLVAQAAAKLTAILAAVRENSDLMGAVSGATRGQASAIAEINAAIRSMDEITQHNAALVEQNNAAIEQAEAQSAELDKIVEAFQLDPNAAGPAVRAPAASAEPKSIVQGMRDRVQRAAAKFQSRGNVAVEEKDWEEF